VRERGKWQETRELRRGAAAQDSGIPSEISGCVSLEINAMLSLLATSAAFVVTGHSRGPAVTPRSITASSVVMRESPEPSMANAACAVLTVQDADASKLSPLLQSAWMEGCIKRGLDGHIEPVASDAVEIVARGPLPRLRSFARWCAAQLPASSELTSDVDLDSCPMPPAKPARPFGLVAGVALEKWRAAMAGPDTSADKLPRDL
jgi:hypothetical protein